MVSRIPTNGSAHGNDKPAPSSAVAARAGDDARTTMMSAATAPMRDRLTEFHRGDLMEALRLQTRRRADAQPLGSSAARPLKRAMTLIRLRASLSSGAAARTT